MSLATAPATTWERCSNGDGRWGAYHLKRPDGESFVCWRHLPPGYQRYIRAHEPAWRHESERPCAEVAAQYPLRCVAVTFVYMRQP